MEWETSIHKGCIKIGRSIDVERRKRQFELCSPREFEIVDVFGPFQIGKAKKLEKDIHNCCKDHQIKGEWFAHEALELVSTAMEEDFDMNIFEKQDIQTELETKLKDAWVLSTVNLDVEDKDSQVHTLDVALHTGSFVFGRVTIGNLSRVNLDGVEEIQCTGLTDVDRCVDIAIKLQEKHCRSQAVQMVA